MRNLFRQTRRMAAAASVMLLLLGLPLLADARPTYFGALTDRYGFIEGDDLYACGVCHRLWTGTGSRNLFGQSVEAQLYLGRTIDQALTLVEPLDSDSDGFTNVEELVTYLTLPGYNCNNFTAAINAPVGYDTFIEPLVPTCLDPHAISVAPLTTITLAANLGDIKTATVTITNNGSSVPLHIDSVAIVNGAPADVTLDGPATPHDIPVGGTSVYTLTFVPTVAQFSNETLRILSDDPDVSDQTKDVFIQVRGFDPVRAPGPIQTACYRDISKEFARYSKTHFSAWGTCQTDEAGGRVCDAGLRDFKIGERSVSLDRRLGGEKDRNCQAIGLSLGLLDYPVICGGNCGHLTQTTVTDLSDCLRCRQEDGMTTLLRDAVGTAPPDLAPPAITDPEAQFCQSKIERAAEKAIGKLYKLRSRCELEAIEAEAESTCDVDTAEAAAKILDKMNKVPARCKSTLGIEGCLFDGPPNPSCLADTVDAIATDLVNATFGLDED